MEPSLGHAMKRERLLHSRWDCLSPASRVSPGHFAESAVRLATSRRSAQRSCAKLGVLGAAGSLKQHHSCRHRRSKAPSCSKSLPHLETLPLHPLASTLHRVASRLQPEEHPNRSLESRNDMEAQQRSRAVLRCRPNVSMQGVIRSQSESQPSLLLSESESSSPMSASRLLSSAAMTPPPAAAASASFSFFSAATSFSLRFRSFFPARI